MMHTRSFIPTLLVTFAMGSLASACEKKGPTDTSPATANTAPKATAEAPTTASTTAASLDDVMAPYEQCRSLLAADKGEGIANCAGAIAKAAGALPETAGAHRKHVAMAAKKLAGSDAGDLDALRLAFGDVSEGIVGLLGDAPEMAKKFHVFECPMAKGYKRWVQVDGKMANPYMGKKMLECGSKVDLGASGADHGDMKHGDHDMKHGDHDAKHGDH